MKKQLLITALFLCFCYFSNAQSEIYGNWTASCVLEKTSISSMCACAICPQVKINDASIEFQNIDITIDEKNIKLGDNAPVPYTWDDETMAISFMHENDKNTFKVLMTTLKDIKLLKESKSGCIVVFQKK